MCEAVKWVRFAECANVSCVTTYDMTLVYSVLIKKKKKKKKKKKSKIYSCCLAPKLSKCTSKVIASKRCYILTVIGKQQTRC